MAKVMVFTPTWLTEDGQMALRPECRASVEGQALPAGMELVWEIGLHNPHPGRSHRNVLAQYQRGRERFLASDCEYLLLFEHDMVMPVGGVGQLVETMMGGWGGQEVGVAYGVYLLRHGSWVLNAWQYVGDHALGESLSLLPKELARARAAGVWRVCGCGFGCTLIRREVVERFPFRGGGGDQFSPDIPFAYDMVFAGVVCVADMGVACDHFDGDLRLRPFGGTMDEYVTVGARQDVVVLDGKESRRLRKGELYAIGRVLADDLLRAGYVEVIEDEKGAESAGEGDFSAVAGQEGGETVDVTREAELAAQEPTERAVVGKGRRRKGL